MWTRDAINTNCRYTICVVVQHRKFYLDVLKNLDGRPRVSFNIKIYIKFYGTGFDNVVKIYGKILY